MTRTRCIVMAACVIVLLLITPQLIAQTCIQDEYNLVNKQKLNCTANDVRIAQVTNVRDLSGNTLPTCVEGSTFSFIADFNVVTTANATNSGGRDNIGLYLQTDPSKASAYFGSCVDAVLYSKHACSSDTANLGNLCGTTGYQEYDPSPDNCGDTSSSVNGNITDTILVSNMKCTSANSVPCPFDTSKKCLSLPNCTSWQVPGSSIQCSTSGPYYPYPFDANSKPEAIPGSPSKCNCAVIALPVQPVNPKPLALKACNTPITTDAPSFSFNPTTPPGTASKTLCDAGVEGTGVATYTIALDNPNVPGSFGDIVVDQICDSAYGQIYPPTGSCKAGTVGSITSTTCSALTVPMDSAQGVFDNYKTCTFVAPAMGELNSVKNIVTFSGHSAVTNTTTFSTQTNEVTVTSTDADATATVTKSSTATIAACATVTYQVQVDNTSSYDEVETLSALNDSPFGSLTSVHDSVLRTDCTVPQTISVGGNYKCTFDAQFCSTVDANTCISHDNTVTATLKSDESTDPTFNKASNKLTVKECLSRSDQ